MKKQPTDSQLVRVLSDACKAYETHRNELFESFSAPDGSIPHDDERQMIAQMHAAISSHHLVKLMGSCKDGQDARQPLPTLRAGGSHIGCVETPMVPLGGMAGAKNRVREVRQFLEKFFGVGGIYEGELTDEEMLGIVDIDGTKYQIVDIGMRMLTPREGFRAHSSPEDYIIDRRADGTPLTFAKQMEKCGNSVGVNGVAALFKSINGFERFADGVEEAA